MRNVKQYRCKAYKHNTGNLYIRFKHKNKPYTISIGVKVQRGESWNQERQRLISTNREKMFRVQHIIVHFSKAIPKFKETLDPDLLEVPIAPRKDDENYDTVFWLLDRYKETVGKHLGTIKTLKYNLTEYKGYKHRKSFNPEEFYLYLKSVCKVSSANHRMTILNRMYKVIWKDEIQYSRSRATPRAIFCFEDNELNDLFNLEPVTPAEQNLLWIYELLYRTGLRYADLKIFKEQFDHAGTRTTIITSKTKKPLTINHTPRITDLVNWFEPMVIAHANKSLKDICKRANLTRLIQGKELWDLASCHIFRKSFATRIHRKGVDILNIMEILCHSSIETTQRYIVPEQPTVNVFSLT